MANFSFTPKLITAKAGDTLTIKLENSQGMHDFVIDELGVKSRLLKDGEEQLVEISIPVDAKGKSYEFYCSVGNHRQMGMVGTLKVN